jgi:hypothetical protein
MARHPFGGSISDYAVTDVGAGAVGFVAGATVLFYTAVSGGTQITDLSTDSAGVTPVTGTTTDASGAVIEVYGPDGTRGMWASANGGTRVYMAARDVPDSVTAAESGLSTLSGTLSAHTAAVNPHGTAFPDLVDTDASARADGFVIAYDGTAGKNKYIPPSAASGAVLLNPPLSGGVYVGNTITEPPPAGGASGNPWFIAVRSYSAADSNPDFMQVKAFWSDLVTRLKTFWLNGNGELRAAPSTPGRIGGRFFESYETTPGFSTGRFFELSTNPTNTANREPLLGAYGSASSTKPGWIEATRILSALQGVAIGGNFNSLSQLIFRGRQTTAGAPSSSTWSVGDVVIDSAGVLWLCTVAGTPGTWVGGRDNLTAWTNLPGLGANVSLGTPAAQYRLNGDNVELRGQLAYAGAVTTLGVLPVGFRPPGALAFSHRVAVSSPSSVFVNIATNGTITTSTAGVNTQTQNLDGIFFSISS